MRATKILFRGRKEYGGWLRERYGDHFAQISTDTSMRLKSSVKDVARVQYGRVPPEIEVFAKRFKMPPQGVSDVDFVFGYYTDEGYVPGSIEEGTHESSDPALREYIEKYPQDWEIVKKCLGLTRQKGRHACLPAEELVITPDMGGAPIPIGLCGDRRVFTGQSDEPGVSTTAYATLLDQGVAEVWEYRFHNGDKLRCTSDHEILTADGWMKISDALKRCEPAVLWDNVSALIVSAKNIGYMQVYDLSVEHWHHSFVHASGAVLHNCAYVISDRPIREFIPLTKISDVEVTQFTSESVEGCGGLKMDFLTVNALNNIKECVSLVQDRYCGGISKNQKVNGRMVPAHRLVPIDPNNPDTLFDIWDLPEDQDVFGDIAEGRTETVFQFSTPGALRWLQYFNERRPDGTKAIRSLEDMTAFTALDRPGPLDVMVSNPDYMLPNEPPAHNMLVEYARRAAGKTGSPDVLPVMERLAPETYGVLCYQETLQRVYKEVTGCSTDEAETFRIYVSKKHMAKIEACYGPFMERAGTRIGKDDAQKLWDLIRTWGQYGFNKSHAVCYANIGYACAYLKHHYPLEWWCSVLRHASKDEVNEKFWVYCGDLIALPDIKMSGENWNIQGGAIRAPLSLLHGIGEKAHAELVSGAPYESLEDFCAHRARVMSHQTKRIVEVKNDKGEIEKKEKTVFSKSCINNSHIRALIITGAMGSLFDNDITDAEAFEQFQACMIEQYHKIVGQHVVVGFSVKKKPKYKKYPKLSDKKMRESMPRDAVERYQMIKSALPAWGTDLRPLLGDYLPEFLDRDPAGMLRYHTVVWDRRERTQRPQIDLIRGIQHVKFCNESPTIPEYGWRVAVVAYVEDLRPFTYHNKTKEAVEILLDIGGIKYRLVHWPDYDTGRLPETAKNLRKGSVVVAILHKRNEKGFSIREVAQVRPPLESGNKKNES